MSKAAPLGIRLFLEGQEVPVIAASVTADPNTAAVASIQVIPTGLGIHLLPRTLVHLFFLDEPANIPGGPGEDLAQAVAEADAIEAGDRRLNRISATDKDYKLMFCGEVVGLSYSKTPTGRQLVLQCLDLSSYWDTCYQWFADYAPGGTAFTDKAHMFVGAGQGLFDNVAGGTKWVVGSLLRGRPKTPEYQNAKGLLGGMIRLFEAIGGIRYRNNKFPGNNGVNDFFTVAELRYNLMGQIGAIEDDVTSARLFNKQAFFDWLRNGMTSLGNLISFRDIVSHVSKHVFHDVYPNPCARYLPGSQVSKAKKFKKKDSSTLRDDTTNGAAALSAIRAGTDFLYGASIRFVVAQSEASTETSRLQAIESGVNLLQQAKEKKAAAELWVSFAKTDDATSVTSDLKKATTNINDALNAVRGEATDLAKKAKRADAATQKALEILKGLTGQKQRAKTTSTSAKVEVGEGDHLFTQLMIPDCFFVSPPRCNVIFPDDYFSFSFSRNFMREVTRLSCQGGMGIISQDKKAAQVIGRHYFAPNVRDSAGRNLKMTLQYGARVLLRHETHSGIIPKFSWITEAHRWGVKATVKKGEPLKGDKIAYVQRLANYQFFLHRWSSRSMSLSCVFKPSLVLGFPALVIDKPLVLTEEVQKAYVSRLGKADIGSQFLGKVAHLDHSINQSSGQTLVTLTHCRLHQGLDDEFLGVLFDEKLEDEKTVDISTDVKAMSEDPNLYGRDRQLRKNLLVLHLRKRLKVERPLRGSGIVRKVKAGQSIELTGQAVKVLNLPSDLVFGASATVPKTLYVQVGLPKGTGEFIRKDISIEDALMPGWFSRDIWSAENVGTKVYQFLLGCYSITDDIAVTSKDLQERLKNLKELGTDGQQRVAAETENFNQGVIGPNEYGAKTLGGVKAGSIEEAVNSIAAGYSYIRNNKDYSVHEFIRNFTYRPIANIEEMLGSADLQYGDDGKPTQDTMVEGFHSRAYGEYNAEVTQPTKEGVKVSPGDGALHLLFGDIAKGKATGVKRKSILNRGEAVQAIRPEFDPRGRALARVRAYVAELELSRGLLG